MPRPDRLFSLEELDRAIFSGEIKNFGNRPDSIEMKLAKQLADTMQENEENCRLLGMSGEAFLALKAENEQLRKLLRWAEQDYFAHNLSHADNWYAEVEEFFHYRNKDSEHG